MVELAPLVEARIIIMEVQATITSATTHTKLMIMFIQQLILKFWWIKLQPDRIVFLWDNWGKVFEFINVALLDHVIPLVYWMNAFVEVSGIDSVRILA